MVKTLFHQLFIYRRGLHYINMFRPVLRNMPKVKLTQQEIQAIRKKYAPLHIPYDLSWFQSYKFFLGQSDPYYVPRDIWKTFELSLNPPKVRFIQCKAMLHHFIDKKYLPVTVINKFHGFIYDQDDNIITNETAANLLLQQGIFVYKPTAHTGGGRDVKLVNLDSVENKEIYVTELLQDDNFICQVPIRPSNRIARFNKGNTTVNTVRCFTICLNGQVNVVSGFLRMGGGNTFNDNIGGQTEANNDEKTANSYVGIKTDGRLCDFALHRINLHQRTTLSPSGLVLKNERLDFWEDIKKIAIEQHQRLPMLGFIAWDFTLDDNDQLRIIEINLDSQNVDTHHIFNGAVFKPYLDDIITYTITHPVFYA